MLGRRPAYVPEGYEFRQLIEGVDAAGFHDLDDQVTLFYTKGTSIEDWRTPLVVCQAAVDGVPLFGTESHDGTSVGIGDLSGVYHDGMWAVGPGPDERRVGKVVFHWGTGVVHSVTVGANGTTYGIRGPSAISRDELTAVAASLF